MAKKQSNFKKAMTMLDISIMDIATQLYIDKTAVSKWRSGSRKLLKKSPYFATVVALMVEKEKRSEHHPFATLWAQSHANEQFSEDKLQNFIESFLLSDDAIDQEVLMSSFDESGLLPQYQCYVGVEGRKKAVDQILSVAEQLPTATHIKILELEQMDWLCRDMGYMRSIMTRLEKLAMNGTTINITFSTANSTSGFRTFLLRLQSLRYLKTVSIHFVNADRINDLIPCVYGIPDYCVAVGLDSAEAAIPIHTNLYSDYLNSHKYSLFYNQVVKVFGMNALVSDKHTQVEEILESVEKTKAFKQDIVYFSDYLSVTTMDKSLLLEILEDNKVSEKQIERCLQYYDTMRSCIEELPNSYFMTYYTNLHALEEAIGFESSNEYELSAICGKVIKKARNN